MSGNIYLSPLVPVLVFLCIPVLYLVSTTILHGTGGQKS